ncbi:MAG: TatD family hydrolase [Bacteroidia bacterium]
MNSFIDTHSHLFAEQFDEDRDQVIVKAKQQGIKNILLPNIDLDSIAALKRMLKDYPKYCYGMMGLHPCSVNADSSNTISKIEAELFGGGYIAVGEIGLDYYWDKTFIKEQKNIFSQQLQWAKQLKLPVAIHTRNSFEDAISIVEEEQDGSLNGVFHCFGGTVDEGKRVIETGFYMGIGGVATFKKSNHTAVLPQLGLERIILETDSPYLAPVPYRGKRNESAYTAIVAQKLASIYEVGLDEIAEKTTKNAIELFRL